MSRQSRLLQSHINKKHAISWFDKTAIVAAFAYPLSGLPQVAEALKGNVDGVSVLSWLGFMAFSLFFMIYGLVYKIKPMIITNVLWLAVDSLVVFAVLMHRTLI